MFGQHTQQHGAADVEHGGGIGTGASPGTVLDPEAETSAGGLELGEEDQLTEGRNGRLGIPFHPDTPAARIEQERIGQRRGAYPDPTRFNSIGVRFGVRRLKRTHLLWEVVAGTRCSTIQQAL